MGTITRNFANNLTTSGLLKAAAFNNDSFDNVTSVPSGSLVAGGMVLIKKITASSSATISFVNGASSVVLDSTYKEYMFTFKNIHPATDNVKFQFNMSTDGGSNYNVTKTTTAWYAYHKENGSEANRAYTAGEDLAQSTAFQPLNSNCGNGNDESFSGTLSLFEPSSATFVKHFISNTSSYDRDDYAVQWHFAGYANTTSAINAVQFKMASGNIDAGDICLYGIV